MMYLKQQKTKKKTSQISGITTENTQNEVLYFPYSIFVYREDSYKHQRIKEGVENHFRYPILITWSK